MSTLFLTFLLNPTTILQMTYREWYERELSLKLKIVDLYVADAVKHQEALTLLWFEPVISDWEPIDFNSPFADRHFKDRILKHIRQKWRDVKVQVLEEEILIKTA